MLWISFRISVVFAMNVYGAVARATVSSASDSWSFRSFTEISGSSGKDCPSGVLDLIGSSSSSSSLLV